VLARLRAAFPEKTDWMVARGVQEGIHLADDAIKGTRFLGSLVGLDLRGHLRRAGIMHRICELAEAGDLPFAAAMMPMPRGNWHWTELKAGRVLAHICRTDGPDAFPEDTPNRQDARLRNTADLFAPDPKIIRLGDVLGEVRELYAWLSYGAMRDGRLSHLCWAVPPADEGEWLAHIDVLRSAAASGPPAAELPPAKTIDPKSRIRFKAHIEEELEKQKRREPKDKK
jgi:hypothetical protein